MLLTYKKGDPEPADPVDTNESEAEHAPEPAPKPVSAIEAEGPALPEPAGRAAGADEPDDEEDMHVFDIEYDDDDDYESDSESESEFDFEEDFENETLIRAKWIMDGASTLDQAIAQVRGFANYLARLKTEGWVLKGPVDDGYGYLYPAPTYANVDMKNKVTDHTLCIRTLYGVMLT